MIEDAELYRQDEEEGATLEPVGKKFVSKAETLVDEFDGMYCSFSADTKVATKYGEKAINKIEIGDYVLAWNSVTGEISFYPVTAKLKHEDQTIVHLVIGDEKINTTPEHPFYTEEKGWVNAGDLKAGMHIRKADGSTGKVKSIKFEQTSQEMYNLTVKDAHTFYVGEGQWLVHNECWNVGDSLDALDEAGNYPSWDTVRERYWMNRAAESGPREFGRQNLALMENGYAPKARIIALAENGEEIELLISKELHHIEGRLITNPHNINNLMELWPWEHAEIDPYRYINYEFLRFK